MPNDRKRVTILSEDAAFGGALRLLLDSYDVSVMTPGEDDHTESDLVVWRVQDSLDGHAVVETMGSQPTLVVAERDAMVAAVDSGCRGFLPDDASLDEIRQGVDTILAGGAVMPPDLLGTLLRHLVARRRQSQDGALDSLTRREMDVFRLAAHGARKEEIGERLYISPATARTHLQRVYRKLGVHSHAELVALAAQIGELNREGGA